jgi:hypothetical protein
VYNSFFLLTGNGHRGTFTIREVSNIAETVRAGGIAMLSILEQIMTGVTGIQRHSSTLNCQGEKQNNENKKHHNFDSSRSQSFCKLFGIYTRNYFYRIFKIL